MRDLQGADAARGIEIGIHHATVAAELQLQAIALADLQSRRAVAANKFLRGKADDAALLLGLGLSRVWLRTLGLLGTRGASGEKQAQGRGDYATHGVTMPADDGEGNVAAR